MVGGRGDAAEAGPRHAVEPGAGRGPIVRVFLLTIGRLKAGPERELAARYLERAAKAGPAIGLAGFEVIEIVESRAARPEARKDEEAAALIAALPAGAALIVLDERGRTVSSEALSERVGQWRDGGRPALGFAIGGPDGHGEAIRRQADLLVAFGAMTWPHQLVRIMAAEQLYRTVTLLSGHPYHRA